MGFGKNGVHAVKLVEQEYTGDIEKYCLKIVLQQIDIRNKPSFAS